MHGIHLHSCSDLNSYIYDYKLKIFSTLFEFHICFQHRRPMKRTMKGPCDFLGLPCDDPEVKCSGTCNERTLSCYNNECVLADWDPYKKKRSAPLSLDLSK